jgi:signal transduction histidine kinase
MVQDVQYGRVRLVPLGVVTGLLVFGWLTSGRVDGESLLMFGGLVLLVGGGHWPLPVAVGESVILFVAAGTFASEPVAVNVLASAALLELTVRRSLRQALVVGVGLAVVCVFADHMKGTPAALMTYVVIPLLLGAWLRLVLLRAKERRLRDLRWARQSERTDIARELHDLVAHHVASIGLRVRVARAVVPDLDPRVGAVLDDVDDCATTALADLRRLVGMLRESPGDGLVYVDPADLPAAVTQVIERAGPDVSGEVDPAIAGLDSVRGLAVLRLVQEGLTNVAKHAGGAHATVGVAVRDDAVHVEVTDDGGPPHPTAEPGYGLIGLRERVELVGGTLTTGFWRTGWRLHATLPTGDRGEAT